MRKRQDTVARVQVLRILERLEHQHDVAGVKFSFAGPMFSDGRRAFFGVMLEVSSNSMSEVSIRPALRTLPRLIKKYLFWEPELICRPSMIKRVFGKNALKRRPRRARKA